MKDAARRRELESELERVRGKIKEDSANPNRTCYYATDTRPADREKEILRELNGEESFSTTLFNAIFSKEQQPQTQQVQTQAPRKEKQMQLVQHKKLYSDLKETHIVIDNIHYGSRSEMKINQTYCFKVNNYIAQIDQYRSVTMPLALMRGPANIELVLHKPNGDNLDESDPAYFKIEYDKVGKLTKLTVPNPLVFLVNHEISPILLMYHNKLCTMPVSAGHYNQLVSKVRENGGSVTVSGSEPIYVELMPMQQQVIYYQPYQQNIQTQLAGENHNKDVCCEIF